MNVREKLSILADAAKYDASCASSGGRRDASPGGMGNVDGMGICHSYAPDGRCISLLKLLMTNYCVYDCTYCVNRVSSDVKRARFRVDELVQLTLDFYRRNYIEGLFLSSGVVQSSDETMEEMIEVARRLREVHHFGGYIHLKAVAGASPECIERAGRYADRLSANIEMPTQQDLDAHAPAKTHAETEGVMRRVKLRILENEDSRKAPARAKAPAFARAGQSTQMIVGATPTTDSAILKTATHLYGSYGLRRVYYSAFSPIPHSDGRLPTLKPPLIREHRLYQADWLIRHYGFKATELVDEAAPNLHLDRDPKLSWAINHRALFPVDINKAPKEQLLRVPGLGLRAVERIILARRQSPVTLRDLSRMRIPLKRARFFVRTADHNVALRSLDSERLARLVAEPPKQLGLFVPTEAQKAFASAVSGEL